MATKPAPISGFGHTVLTALLHYTRCLHIAAGFMGFFVAPVSLAVRKGGRAQRRYVGSAGPKATRVALGPADLASQG